MGMARTRTFWVVATAVVLSTCAVVLDEVITSPGPGIADVPLMLLVFLAAFTITTGFAVWTATSLGLPSFLVLAPISSQRRWLRFAVYGVGAGILIYLTNSFYLTSAAAPFRPPPVSVLDSHLKVFSLSARAALSEETMFRLFAIPFLVSLGMRFYGWRPRFGFESGPAAPPAGPPRTPRRMVMVALILSALIFGMAHETGSVAATGFGLILGISYLRGGWETAVTAHFLGNYLLFVGLYL